MPFQLSQPLQVLNALSATFPISKNVPLIFDIIDDIAVLMEGWPDDLAISWCRINIVIVQSAGLLLSPKNHSLHHNLNIRHHLHRPQLTVFSH